MGSDDLKRRKDRERKHRISKEYSLRAETWLIVCEGKQTEPNYFKSLFEYVNSKYLANLKYKIVGTGRNTVTLVKSVSNLFDFTSKEVSKVNIPYGKVFVVFDKDDFTPNAFNKAIEKCENNGYIALWSNECIELWFLLHFNYLDTGITRKQYFEKLSKILNVKYEKNQDHFGLLNTDDNLSKAYKNAKRLADKSQIEKSYANRKPCTMVYKLIDELEEYIGKQIK